MIDVPHAWLIVAPSGHEFGSFNDRNRADEYAAAIRERRGLPCEVVPRDDRPQTTTTVQSR